MKKINQAIAKSLTIILISALMISCASIPQLKVRYRLPPQSDRLKGRKLENEGMELAPRQTLGEPELLIVLNEFLLDLVDRRWMVKMSYEAKLLKEGKVLATRTINGQAERFKLIGRDEADTAVGEIFTDMINRLDVLGLFQSTGL
jgi:hypothetical protein